MKVLLLPAEGRAGKSTLLNLLTFDEPPKFGTLRIDGRPATEYDPSSLRRHTAILFQKQCNDPFKSYVYFNRESEWSFNTRVRQDGEYWDG